MLPAFLAVPDEAVGFDWVVRTTVTCQQLSATEVMVSVGEEVVDSVESFIIFLLHLQELLQSQEVLVEVVIQLEVEVGEEV
jgi:hypothetical protein